MITITDLPLPIPTDDLREYIEQTYDEDIHTFEGSPEYLAELTDNQRRAVWQERADSDTEREY